MIAQAIIPAVWLLALVAAIAFLARPGGRAGVREGFAMLLAFALSFGIGVWVHPQPNWIAMSVAILAAWRVIEPGRPGADPALAGVCAGLAAALHVAGGLAPWLAGPVALGVLLAGTWLVAGRIARIRPILLVTAALALPVIGFAPDVAAGWRTGEALSQTARIASPSGVVPVWALLVVGLALLAGAVRGLYAWRLGIRK